MLNVFLRFRLSPLLLVRETRNDGAKLVAQVVPTPPVAKVHLQDELTPVQNVGRPEAFPARRIG
jgi:hypothetical protein